jgi:hypothetical protein
MPVTGAIALKTMGQEAEFSMHLVNLTKLVIFKLRVFDLFESNGTQSIQ